MTQYDSRDSRVVFYAWRDYVLEQKRIKEDHQILSVQMNMQKDFINERFTAGLVDTMRQAFFGWAREVQKERMAMLSDPNRNPVLI